jgi:large subunit ribosomal protein L29
MRAKELKSKPKDELESQLLELQKELIKLNTQVATGTALKNPGQINNIKKNMARLKTALKAK